MGAVTSPSERVLEFLIGFVQELFRCREPGDYQWLPDGAGDIEVHGGEPDQADADTTRPRVVLSRGPITVSSIGGGNVRTGALGNSRTAVTTLQRFVIFFRVKASEGLEAKHIVDWIVLMLQAYKPEISKFKYLHQLSLERASITQESPANRSAGPTEDPVDKEVTLAVPAAVQVSALVDKSGMFGSVTKYLTITRE